MCVCVCVCVYVCVSVCACVCVCVRVCVSTPEHDTIPADWLNKFCIFYIAGIVDIISRCGIRFKVHAHHKDQPNKSKVALYNPLCESNKTIVHK